MPERCVIVLDVGKTNAKLTLWDPESRELKRRVRANEVVQGHGYRALDARGLEDWLTETLREYASSSNVAAIVSVAHGVAAALVCDGQLFAAPMDYEDEVSPVEHTVYNAERDDFRHTGSPALPQDLNLGMQLHRLERLTDPWPDDLYIVTWLQYGFGPFPHADGDWRNKPQDSRDQRDITGLYLALMANDSLNLIGSRDRLLIEGRFAETLIFIFALAALRPHQKVFVSNARNVVTYGALRLINPALPLSLLTAVEPLDVDFSEYAERWCAHAAPAVA